MHGHDRAQLKDQHFLETIVQHTLAHPFQDIRIRTFGIDDQRHRAVQRFLAEEILNHLRRRLFHRTVIFFSIDQLALQDVDPRLDPKQGRSQCRRVADTAAGCQEVQLFRNEQRLNPRHPFADLVSQLRGAPLGIARMQLNRFER